jgi:hypothetical protein
MNITPIADINPISAIIVKCLFLQKYCKLDLFHIYSAISITINASLNKHNIDRAIQELESFVTFFSSFESSLFA